MWDKIKCEHNNHFVNSNEIVMCSICKKHYCKKHFKLHNKEVHNNKAKEVKDENILRRNEMNPIGVKF